MMIRKIKDFNILYLHAEKIISEWNKSEEFGSDSNLRQMLYKFIDTDFPNGLNNLPKTINLYRLEK